jgi:hypothetical protein
MFPKKNQIINNCVVALIFTKLDSVCIRDYCKTFCTTYKIFFTLEIVSVVMCVNAQEDIVVKILTKRVLHSRMSTL